MDGDRKPFTQGRYKQREEGRGHTIAFVTGSIADGGNSSPPVAPERLRLSAAAQICWLTLWPSKSRTSPVRDARAPATSTRADVGARVPTPRNPAIRETAAHFASPLRPLRALSRYAGGGDDAFNTSLADDYLYAVPGIRRQSSTHQQSVPGIDFATAFGSSGEVQRSPSAAQQMDVTRVQHGRNSGAEALRCVCSGKVARARDLNGQCRITERQQRVVLEIQRPLRC